MLKKKKPKAKAKKSLAETLARDLQGTAAEKLAMFEKLRERGAFDAVDQREVLTLENMLTPDSSRYWKLGSYEARMKAGQEPEYFDKEFLRLWFRGHCDPYMDAKLPEAPQELVNELSRRYIEMYETITGTKFQRGEMPIKSRIEKNLEKYRIVWGARN